MAGLEGEYSFEWKWRSIGEYLDYIDTLDLCPATSSKVGVE